MALINPILKNSMLAVALAGLVACETVQTTQGGAVGIDRKQQMLVSSQEMEAASSKEYAQVLAQARDKGQLNRSAAQTQRVRAVANRLIPQTGVFRQDALQWKWEVNVLASDEANAWCMPGGKIAVYSGLIDKLNISDDELAAVMGHEIAHALREHARERASQQAVANSAISLGAALLGLGDVGQQSAQYAYMGLMGLPNSRANETEADRIGVELAARAGYDPKAAVTLWQKMAKLGGEEPMKFLSTHPSSADRIADLTVYAQRVEPLYRQSRKTR
ncbi:Zn-dependent protease with chaperone function [Herbaspirillum sp. SJZ130]|nr:putative Zn-dependent protease [Herbaspirillum sp. SJZ102]TQK13374.1 Zn-dependent protease with chaperone function [Herbaspirillum sp. SJZ130]TQK15378.1 Zn-dependent protease with chaperone function [Herbaspirillum sp. SJZ106]TWC71273.1 Zn-dependent protease with chaperone function [Herbaspirillum sp. SJZ099]